VAPAPLFRAQLESSTETTNLSSRVAMVAEAAVVGITDELTGQAVNAFVSLKNGNETTDQVRKDLVMQVRKSIGPFAAPKAIFVVDDLPKTRSGKIMRRILRKILSGEEDSLGDTSTVCSWLLDWRTRSGPQIE
jgi:acyl-coenzyme A synthetase/AMP-(fatty) acid ligase